jgi:sugar lactone lactonase YvrE
VADRESCRLRRFVSGGSIETVAGTGACSFSGDGGLAIEAALHRPGDVTLAADGAIYVADTGNCRVRRIDGSGNISTVAGSGVCAFGGDGGPAIAGGAWHPMGLAMDDQGAWFFSELDTCRVRRVDAGGAVTTYAGTGVCGFSGDGGPATEARLSDFLGGLALADDGTLFIAEGYNCRVRRIDPNGVIETVAGTGVCDFSGDGGPAREASLDFVSDVALDGSGGLYVAGPFNCRVRRIDLATGVIDTVVGDGSCSYNGEDLPALAAGVEPWGVAVGPDGGVYLADAGNCRVRQVDAEGRIVTVAGGDACGFAGDGGQATQAQLIRPYDVVLDSEGNLYVADLRTFTVRKVDRQGIISTVAGVGISRPIDIGGYDPTSGFLCSLHSLPVPAPSYLADGGPASEGGLYFPYGIALSHDGHLYIADTFDHRVRRVTCGAGVPCAGPAAPATVTNEEIPAEVVRLPATGRPAESGRTTPIVGALVALAGSLLLAAAARLVAGRRHGGETNRREV